MAGTDDASFGYLAQDSDIMGVLTFKCLTEWQQTALATEWISQPTVCRDHVNKYLYSMMVALVLVAAPMMVMMMMLMVMMVMVMMMMMMVKMYTRMS